MKTKYLKPAPNTVFRQPEQDYRPMAPEGQEVVMTPYYARGLQDGDLIEVADQPAPETDQHEMPFHTDQEH